MKIKLLLPAMAAALGLLSAANAQNPKIVDVWAGGSDSRRADQNLLNRVWTDTGVYINEGDKVTITALADAVDDSASTPAYGFWSWGSGGAMCSPKGDKGYQGDYNKFLQTDPLTGKTVYGAALIAYIGDDPTHGNNSTFFPVPNTAIPNDPVSYRYVGVGCQFISRVPGKLWLGFNDDSQCGVGGVPQGNELEVTDNTGYVKAQISIGDDPPPPPEGPLFYQQPRPFTILCGQDPAGNYVELDARAIGAGFIKYQWWKDGVKLKDGDTGTGSTISYSYSEDTPFTQGAYLMIANAGPADSGIYTVVATDEDGSTTVSDEAKVVIQVSTPVAWWPGDGNAQDIIGRNDGVLEGNYFFAPGEVGCSFYFNGVDADMRVPYSPDSPVLDVGSQAGFTLEAWINPADLQERPIFEWNTGLGGVGYGVHFWISERTPYGGGPGCLYANIVDENNGDHWVSSAGDKLRAGVFQHVALTFDKSSGDAILYLDGSQVGSAHFDPIRDPIRPKTACDLYLGNRPVTSWGASRWAGQIDEAGVYNRALTTDEIRSIYLAGNAGKCPPTCVAPPAGQVAWWPGDGNGRDIVGGNNLLQGQGVMAFDQGWIGQAFSFNGASDLMVPGSRSLDVSAGRSVTIECWIKPANVSAHGYFPLCAWSDGQTGLSFYVGGESDGAFGAVFVDRYETTDRNVHRIETSSGLVASGDVHHVALTYQSGAGQATLYCDGSQVAQQTIGSFMNYSSFNWHLGFSPMYSPNGQWGPPGTFYSGLMDEVGIYNRALTSLEIAAIYNAGQGGKRRPAHFNLVSWWAAENNANDVMGNNNGLPEGSLSYSAGEVGSAFSFNGSYADVRVPASLSLDVGNAAGFTLAAWIKPADLQQRPIFEWNNGSGSSASYGVHFWTSVAAPYGTGPGCLYANIIDTGNVSYTVTSAGGLLVAEDNHFRHVALTYDRYSGSARLYLDGNEVGSRAVGWLWPKTYDDLYIGARPTGPGATRWKGQIDEPSVHNRALSPEEIRAIYNAGMLGRCR